MTRIWSVVALLGLFVGLAGPVAAQTKFHDEAVAVIGEEELERSMKRSTMKAAALTTTRFCTPRITNMRQLTRTLKRSGYLVIMSDKSVGMQMYAHPSGAPMVITVELSRVANGCGGIAGRRALSPSRLKRVLEEDSGDTLTRLPRNMFNEVKLAWRSKANPKLVYAEYIHSGLRSPLVVYVRE